MLFTLLRIIKVFANAVLKRHFVVSVALASLFTMPALVHAQNLLVNGDFEAVVQPNFGNNIGGNISPWMIGGGSLPNPVKVNGSPPGGGPVRDHTNPSGIGTYLDVAGGSNSFYQVFTVPLCPSAPVKTYRLTGWFTTRDNSAGFGSIELRNGAGLGGAVIPGSQAIVNMPAGNSATDPWVFASVDGVLTSGQTFSFVVSMNNNANADDLSLVLLDALCPPDLSLVKDDGGLNFGIGSTGVYNFTVRNGSVINSPTSGTITVKDVLPAGLSFQAPLTPSGVNGAAWSCVVSTTSNPNDTATCTSSAVIVAAGASAFSLPVAVALTIPDGTVLSNKAKVFGGGDVNKPTETSTGLISSCASDGLGGDSPNGGCGFEDTTISVPKIDVVKAVSGTFTQVNPTTFDVPYSIVLKNTGTVVATNFQAVDDLSATFATGTPTITLQVSPTVTASGGATAAQCALNTGYGTTAATANLFSGQQNLPVGGICTVTFTARVAYASAAAIPTTAQNNSVVASAYTTPPATPGGTGTGLVTTDTSTTGTTPPATPGGDTPTPTPVTLTPQKIDVVKAAGVPLQVAPGRFEIAYNVVVGNKSAATVYNVQANDNLLNTFAAPASFSIKAGSYSVTATGGTCAGNAAFNGNAETKLLAGTDDWSTGQSCSIKYTVVVDYGTNPIPANRFNSALASGMGADSATPNPGHTGITQDPTTGVITGGTPPVGYTTVDTSTSGTAPPAGSPPGTPPTPPSLPPTPGGDTPTPTPVGVTPQKIDVVKAAGVPKQVGPKKFEISYSVLVANVCKESPLTCATTPIVYNVQANDNLANTFPTAESIVVSNYAVTSGANGALCTAASPAFAGTATTSAMLSGVNDLEGGQSCIITFKATIDFGSNAIPTVSQNNMVYGSGTGVDTIPNLGYTYAPDGKPLAPINASTTDASTTAPPTTGAPGTLPATPLPPTTAGGDSDTGVPTPIILVIEEDGELQIKKSTIIKEASAGDVVEYTVSVTNTSSNPVKAKVTDTPPVGFEYVADSAKVGSVSISSTASGGSLVFDIGTIPAKSTISLTYKMKLGDAVEAGDATNCVAANGTNTLTGGDKESGKSCANVIIKTGLFLEKRANVTKAELGDSVEYSLRVKSVGGTTKNVTISDNLPLGFKLIEGTVKVIRGGVTSAAANPAGSPGPALTFNVGTVANKEVVEIRYRLRLGIGSDLGDGINKAQAKAPYATSSLIATAKVLVTRGVFTREACVAGKVFVDCNQNKVQDKCEAGSKDGCEPGIPGVRLYMEDGTNITTDENGQYSICGVRAINHVMLVDMTTMPIGSRMGITSNENLGSGKSLMMNIKAGELHRADFIESSCFPKILDQVEQRRQNSAGAVNVPLIQKGQDKLGIVFDAKEQELLAPALRGVK